WRAGHRDGGVAHFVRRGCGHWNGDRGGDLSVGAERGASQNPTHGGAGHRCSARGNCSRDQCDRACLAREPAPHRPGAGGPVVSMSTLREALAVTGMSLRSLPARYATSLVVVVGIATVVAVLVSVLAMSRGFLASMTRSGRPERALVLSRNADVESNGG